MVSQLFPEDITRLQAEAAAGSPEAAAALAHFVASLPLRADVPSAAASVFQPAPAPSAGSLTAGSAVNVDGMPKFNVTDTGLADTDFTITHNLGYTVNFYLLLSASLAGSLYTGTVAGDADSITLKYSGANANLWIGLI